MLSIREDLKTAEAAKAYNRRISDYRCEAMAKSYHTGCISALACEHCYHVISDSICLCVGVFTCPKCGADNGRAMVTGVDYSKQNVSWGFLTDTLQPALEFYI